MFQGLLQYFSRALNSVADVSRYGKEKYDTEYAGQNWTKVDGAEGRYLDAALRHLTAHSSGESVDPESGRRHLAHAAWNVLAVLELGLRAEVHAGVHCSVVPTRGTRVGPNDGLPWEYSQPR